jgi:hypothetical protein
LSYKPGRHIHFYVGHKCENKQFENAFEKMEKMHSKNVKHVKNAKDVEMWKNKN